MCVCFSVGYDDHKVSLGCRSSQPAAVEATLPLSHEMSWQAARGATHNTRAMMLIARTHKTPRKMLTQHQHVLLCRNIGRRRRCSNSARGIGRRRRGKRNAAVFIQNSRFLCVSSFLLSHLMGDRGDRWRELLTLLPPLPNPNLPPSRLPLSLMFVS